MSSSPSARRSRAGASPRGVARLAAAALLAPLLALAPAACSRGASSSPGASEGAAQTAPAPGSAQAAAGEAGPSAHAAPGASQAYVSDVEAWRDRRVASLTADDGWLSLVGLYWLEPGANTFGSTPDNSLIFPQKAPAHAGTLHLEGGKVTVEPASGSGIELADAPGEAVAGKVLASDAQGEPTVLEMGTLRFYVIERGDRVGIRVKDSESPVRTGFVGLDYYRIDPAWKVEARLEPAEGATVPVPNVLGQVEDAPSPGTLVFQLPGAGDRTFRLRPIQEGDSDELFLVFGDPTNGRETYGGGRFLYADAPGPDGRVVLDFNRAYNPPCAFTPFATCPLPPPGNKLPLKVTAGEKKYAHEVPHHAAG